MNRGRDGTVWALDPTRPYKPLDVGEGGVVASLNASGRLLAVSQGHPVHGAVNLTSAPAFNESCRLDPESVRRYRRGLATRGAASFGLQVGGVSGRSAGQVYPAAPGLIEGVIPLTPMGPTRVATFVPHPDDTAGVRGVVQLFDRSPGEQVSWTGCMRLERAPFPELTETHPLVPFRPVSQAAVTENMFVLDAPDLGWSAACRADFARAPHLVRQGDGFRVRVPLAREARVVAIGLGDDPGEASEAGRYLFANAERLLAAELSRWKQRWTHWPGTRLDFIVRRGLSYVISCCAVPVGETTCLVTDHRILPLTWTRDSYFMARALLDWHRHGGPHEVVELVRRHLAWLFEVAERPEGWWARAHMVGGQRKDLAFQLDQQIYPLVELVDYVEATGDVGPLTRYAAELDEVLGAIEARKADGVSLFATEEGPQDDLLKLPYETSNQILAWHAFQRLDRLGVGGGRLRILAQEIARDVRRLQVINLGDGKQRFAYATDLVGEAFDYHDANDMPMALAPAWGFCPKTDPTWTETIRFAFSSENPGFFPGRRGGLGSLHTPAPWPLGQVQAYLVGASLGDADAREAAERALRDAALWDGSLPEASDPETAKPRSRSWFAWPAASVASALLNEDT